MLSHAWKLILPLALASVLVDCRQSDPAPSGTKSGGGINPLELGCEGIQANWVDDGQKFDETLARYRQLKGEPAAAATAVTSPVDAWRGVAKTTAFRGELSPLLSRLGLPADVPSLAGCTRFAGKAPDGLYDACSELFLYATRLQGMALTWDQNLNGKKCYEGQSFNPVKNPEFGYCDNECAFTDDSCVACRVTYDGGQEKTFLCKSQASTTDAIGGFCRNTGVHCDQLDPRTACERRPGRDFAGGTTTSLGGPTIETFEAALSGYVGASEEVQVKAGVAAGEKVEVRGTATGKLGFIRTQGVGAMFTPSGYGVNGLAVKCFLEVSGVAGVSYDAKFGAGGDFIIASSEATVNAGGSFSLTKTYRKVSPEFSGAGQTADTIMSQCLSNYVTSWMGVELQNWIDQYSGLRLIEQTLQQVTDGLGISGTSFSFDSSSVYCRYPSYDADNYYRTGDVWVTMKLPDSIEVQWSHYLRGWWNRNSAKVNILECGDINLRPYLRALKDGTMTGSQQASFYNDVIVPASRCIIDEKWHLDSCFSQEN